MALAAESEDQTLDRTLLVPGIRALFEDPSRGRYYIAEIGGRPVGQLMTTYEWSDWRNGAFLWIQSVYVLPTHRARGVFRSLYAHLRERRGPTARLRHPAVCGRGNSRALAVYERLGMHRSNYALTEEVFRGPVSHVEEETDMLAIGERAPDFSLPDGDGREQRLSVLQHGQPLILYFYPPISPRAVPRGL